MKRVSLYAFSAQIELYLACGGINEGVMMVENNWLVLMIDLIHLS